MEDTSRAQKLKLANSKKRFKELQELKKKRNSEAGESFVAIGDVTPLDSLTSSTHSSVNNELKQESIQDDLTPLLKYFPDIYQEKCQQSGKFFGDTQAYIWTDKKSTAGKSNVQICDYFSSAFSHASENYRSDVHSTNSCGVKDDELDLKQIETIPVNVNNDEMDNENVVEKILTVKEHSTNVFSQDRVSNSSIESLRQLSEQMAQLIEPECCTPSSVIDLGERNLELVVQLEQEKIKSEQQQILISELEMKMTQLEKELKEKTECYDVQIAYEVNKLKEELQCHIQTVGMLVAEKTELSANLSQFELCSKQKSTECEELKARLKTSRSRVADLERDVNNLKSEKDQNNTIKIKQIGLISQLEQECSTLKDQKEELMQDLLEVREKLRNSSQEKILLQQENKELSKKLSLATIKIQQISNGQQLEGNLENITKEKFELEKQILELNKLLKIMTKERDDSHSQYQQYAQQQSVQLINISNRLEQLQLENEILSKQEQNRVKHISELERQLQYLQTDQVTIAMNKTSNNLETTKELCVQLQIEKSTIEEDYMKTNNEKEMLLKELQAKNESLSQLENLVEQLRGCQPDTTKLLATIESDKVAAAKAVQQNMELKQQLGSMQEVFIKLNNDKVELTEQLNRELNSNKELLEKLQKTELQLQRLTDAVEIKDRELFHLLEKSNELNKQVLQNEQLTDRLRHYESLDNSSYAILNELKEAKQIIITLTNEINVLKHQVNEKKLKKKSNIASVTEYKTNNAKLQNDVEQCIEENNHSQKDDNSNDSNILDKEIAMTFLEEKFKSTMQSIADLMEEKQRLEHLVMQLQGETETIGEYVALYQHQRNILKQKALEGDLQLQQLAIDREQMKIKLDRLIELIGKLDIEIDTAGIKHIQQVDDNCDNKYRLTEIAPDSTVEEILALLSEMKCSSLMHFNENIHHCPWCSGQLITV